VLFWVNGRKEGFIEFDNRDRSTVQTKDSFRVVTSKDERLQFSPSQKESIPAS
jgi:hypothetical protein